MLMVLLCCLGSFIVFYDVLVFFWSLPLISFLFLYYYGFSFDGLLYGDFLSMVLVLVTFWIFFLSIMAMDLSFSGFLTLWGMLCFLCYSFMTVDYLNFYFSFEFVFVLMFLFLLGWGGSLERLQASFYMFFYTMFFSLPFLVLILSFFSARSGLFFSMCLFSGPSYFWVFMFLVFLIKLPIFGFHLWLPKAHVEAPVSGSMVLAGVLLKLGGYGLIRFFVVVPLWGFSNSFFICLVFYLSLIGGLLVSLLCIRQMDLKMMIAYSSVVHMSFMLLGVLSFSFVGLYGAQLMLVCHGFISSALFFLLTLFYSLLHSRSIMVLKGAISLSPIFVLLWLLFCSLNLSVPPFMSFYSEVCISGSLGFLTLLDWFFIGLSLFLSGVYCIYMYVTLSHGTSVFCGVYSLGGKTLIVSLCHIFFVLLYPLVFIQVF